MFHIIQVYFSFHNFQFILHINILCHLCYYISELIDSVNPYLPGLPPHQIAECRRSIRAFIKNDNQISEDDLTGEITVNYSLVIAVAKKPKKQENK